MADVLTKGLWELFKFLFCTPVGISIYLTSVFLSLMTIFISKRKPGEGFSEFMTRWF